MKKFILFLLIAQSSYSQHLDYLDPSFASDGYYIIGSPSDANNVAIQHDGKIVVAYTRFVYRHNTDGSLDSTFGTNGRVAFGNYDYLEGMILQADDKIIVTGHGQFSGNDAAILVIRLNPDGSRDSSFGNSSNVLININISSNVEVGYGLGFQSDGSILVAGIWNDSTGSNSLAIKLMSNGSLDSSFASGGIRLFNFDLNDDEAYAIATQANGKILFAGRGIEGIVRLNSDGSTDSTFGIGGITLDTVLWGDIKSLFVLPDGKILANGRAILLSDPSIGSFNTTIRYTSNGEIDFAFGINGGVYSSLIDTAGLCKYNWGESLTVRPDGKIVTTGYSSHNYNGTYSKISIFQYTPDGLIDSSFGDYGSMWTYLGNNTFTAGFDVAIQSDGKIVIAAEWNDLFDYTAGVFRYMNTGIGVHEITLFPKNLNAYFNDGSLIISFTSSKNCKYYLLLYDISGRELCSATIHATIGKNSRGIANCNFVTGVYVATLKNNEEVSLSKKLIIE